MSTTKHNDVTLTAAEEMELARIDVDGDGIISAEEARAAAKSSAGLRASNSRLWKMVLGVFAMLFLSWLGNACLMAVVFNLSKDLKVEGNALKNTDGGAVSTHNQKTKYSVTSHVEKNATESRRRLQAGGSIQVAAVPCAVVQQGIKSIKDGDNEGAVEMQLDEGTFFTASVTANFYHAGGANGTFGIEGIHLDGDLDVTYNVECENEKCSNVAGYKCPVLGLAVTGEGRRQLRNWLHDLGDIYDCVAPAGVAACLNNCHPAGSYLTLEDGQSIAIERATVGTLVKTDTGFQPILGFLHADEDMVGSYLHFTTPSASMAISPLHHAFVNGTEIDPSFIKLGDLLHTPDGLEPVTRIETLEERGAYHFIVKGGSYYVDGILASDFDGAVSRAVWPFVHAYVGARYSLGIPVIPSGKGLFPRHDWMLNMFVRAGVPLWAQQNVLTPLIVVSSILTELANVAAEHFPAWLGTVAAATAAIKAGRKLRGGKA